MSCWDFPGIFLQPLLCEILVVQIICYDIELLPHWWLNPRNTEIYLNSWHLLIHVLPYTQHVNRISDIILNMLFQISTICATPCWYIIINFNSSSWMYCVLGNVTILCPDINIPWELWEEASHWPRVLRTANMIPNTLVIFYI